MPTPIFAESFQPKRAAFAMPPQPTILPRIAVATNASPNHSICSVIPSKLILMPMLAKKIGANIIYELMVTRLSTYAAELWLTESSTPAI